MLTIIRLAIIAILIFIVLGFIFSLFPTMPHIPGYQFYRYENFTFYFPVVTCGSIAGAITAILWFLKKI